MTAAHPHTPFLGQCLPGGVEWQDEMAKIKMKEQKLQKVEGKGFFFIFYLKIV
jgi:hypothetical protein